MLKLPRITVSLNIVDANGRATVAFSRLWDTFATAIEENDAAQAASILSLQEAFAAIQAATVVAQAAQETANVAQATADAAGGGTATSGSANGVTEAGVSGWQTGPQVDLTGVVAGDLTISGTGPQQDGTTVATQNMTGDFRVVEIVGMTETTVFTGNHSIIAGNPATVLNNSAATVTAFTSARTSTGAVSYRIDTQRTDAGFLEAGVNLPLYIFARRS